jgi:hypothetical protein
VSIAADHFGKPGQTGEYRNLFAFQSCDVPLDHRQIIGDQPSLGSAFRGLAERIERRAAQKLQTRQQPEGVDHPAAILLLLQMARRLVAARQQRRGKMEFEADVALEFFA